MQILTALIFYFFFDQAKASQAPTAGLVIIGS